MRPDLEKIVLDTNVSLVVVRNMELDDFYALIKSIPNKDVDLPFVLISDDSSIETISEEDMNKAGWCRCE